MIPENGISGNVPGSGQSFGQLSTIAEAAAHLTANNPMTKNRTPQEPAIEPPLSLQKAEKGSHRSMWELLLQLRVLLPYLSHLVPLLERGLDRGLDRGQLKSGPDLTQFSRTIAEMQTGTRDLEVQARNQALQLERIEQQMARLRVVHENSMEENHRLFADMRSFRRWMLILASVLVLLLGASVGMLAFLVFHP
jgi:hypothetical protein